LALEQKPTTREEKKKKIPSPITTTTDEPNKAPVTDQQI
jgi:hypothetical protein